MCLTIGITILYSTTETQLVSYSQCTVDAPVWSYKASIYVLIDLFFLTDLHMHLTYPSVESESIAV